MFVWAPLVMRTSADGMRPDTANEIYTASSLLPIHCQMIILTSLHLLVKIIRNLLNLISVKPIIGSDFYFVYEWIDYSCTLYRKSS